MPMKLLFLQCVVLCLWPCLAMRVGVLQAINNLLQEGQSSPAALMDMSKMLYSEELPPSVRRKAACGILDRVQRALVGEGGAAARSELLGDNRFADLLICSAFGLAAFYGSTDDVDLASSVKIARALAVLSDGTYSLHPGVLDRLLPALLKRQSQVIGKGSKEVLGGSDIEALEWSYNRLLATNEGFGSLVDLREDVQDSLGAIVEAKEKLKLPFQVLHGVTAGSGVTLEQLVHEIPFRNEQLVTRAGKKVVERRRTCWMVESGSNIEGLAYSGKVMAPTPFSAGVERVRDLLEERMGLYFDCGLVNLYEDGQCACAWHCDPDMGTMWSTDSIICSFGETRRFSVRALGDSTRQYTYHLHTNDGFLMTGECNDAYQHCIMGAENDAYNGQARLSIVFKRALVRAGGRRGHGLGRGRRDS